MFRNLICLFACIALCWTPLAADEDENGIVQVRIPLPHTPRYVAPTHAGIWVPTDFPRREGWGSVRSYYYDFQSNDVFPFAAPPSDEGGLSSDAYIEMIGQWNPAMWEQSGRDLMAVHGTLYAHATKAEVEDLRRAVAWTAKGATPGVRVRATLAATRPEEGLRATGAATLRPGQWTRVYFERDMVPFVVEYEIEIAQESTSMNPLSMEMPQGQELYMRYHPGELVSIVELWAADVEHTDVVNVDLSAIRNVPEGNAPGPVTMPRSRVQRARTALLVSNEKTTHTIQLSQGGSASTLTLSFDRPPAPHVIGNPRKEVALGMLRIGAISDALDFGSRPASPEQWMELAMGRIEYAGIDPERFTMMIVSEISSVFVAGYGQDARVVQRMRDDVVKEEQELRSVDVGIRVLSVPESTYRKAVGSGSLRLLDPVSAETLATLKSAGAAQTARMRMPVVVGVGSGFRVGECVPGFVDCDVEVAQQAAGMDPINACAFAGMLGDVRVDATGAGYALSVNGTLAWASSEVGMMELVFRPPVGMQFSRERFLAEPDQRRKIKLPVLGGGASRVAAEISVGTADGQEHVLGAIARGDEVSLVLGSVAARR